MAVSRRPGDIRDGAMVIRVQNALLKRALDPGPINGQFGDQTERAVMEFQSARGLPATGIVDQRTWTALGLKGAVPRPVIID